AELILVDARAIDDRQTLAAQDAFELPALLLVVEDHRKVAREGLTPSLLDTAALEEFVEQRGAGFVHRVLTPKLLVADDDVEAGEAMQFGDVDLIEADVLTHRLGEDADEEAAVVVLLREIFGEQLR